MKLPTLHQTRRPFGVGPVAGARQVQMVGEYVHIIVPSSTYRGTIIDSKTEDDEVKYLFHHDPRFNDDRLPDFWVAESDIEVCVRPTDADVVKIKGAGM